MTIPLWLILAGIFLIALFTLMIVIALYMSKGKTYVVLDDGYSAKINVYALCLIDKDMHRVWIKTTKDGPMVETVHDLIPLEGRKEVWVNNSKLTFIQENGEYIVRWGKDLEIWHD